MGLAEATVFASGLHGGSGFNGLAEGLDCDPRRLSDVVVGGQGGRLRLVFGD